MQNAQVILGYLVISQKTRRRGIVTVTDYLCPSFGYKINKCEVSANIRNLDCSGKENCTLRNVKVASGHAVSC